MPELDTAATRPGGAGIGNHRVALDEPAAQALLEAAWTAGVRLFDTAPHYGLGLSERRLGAFLAGRARDEFRVSTKVGRRLVAQDNPTGALDDEGFAVPADLRRGVGLLRGGHPRLAGGVTGSGSASTTSTSPTSTTPSAGTSSRASTPGSGPWPGSATRAWSAAIGVGSMSTEALLAAARTGLVDELMVAGRYTLLDRSAERELLPLCAESGIEVVAAAVLNSGLLAGHPAPTSTFDYDVVPADVLARALRLDELCDAAGVPLAAAALQFPLRHPAVQRVVVGAVDAEQLAATLALLATPVPVTLWDRLERAGAPAEGASR